jgi:hypothetical protein
VTTRTIESYLISVSVADKMEFMQISISEMFTVLWLMNFGNRKYRTRFTKLGGFVGH